MNLRRQLLLVSLLLLTLPWAGCQFVREMEGALRAGQEQALQATTQAIAASLVDQPQLLYPQSQRIRQRPDSAVALYARTSPEPIIVDGYADGWPQTYTATFSSSRGSSPLTVAYQAATRNNRLYLLLQVTDDEVVYHNPGLAAEPNGDRLILRTWLDGRRQEYVIATAAPGSVRAQAAGLRHPRVDAASIQGFWQDTSSGYVLELELPLQLTGDRLGFYITSVGNSRGQGLTTVGNVRPLDTTAPPWLVYAPVALLPGIELFRQSGRQALVVDNSHYLLARSSSTEPAGTAHDDAPFWLVRALYRRILAADQLATLPVTSRGGRLHSPELDEALAGRIASRWYRDPAAGSRAILSAAAPITSQNQVIGSVILRQSSEQYLSLTDRAFSRLLGYSLSALSVAALGLLGFASVLSWRIHRLNKATQAIITSDGDITGSLPSSSARDEIGELSRSYAVLLGRVRDYNNYLQSLSSKLSDVLRTPMSVVKSSLENLEHSDSTGDQQQYLARASQGLHRLVGILNAMSEASQLEASIRSNSLREQDLVPLVQELFGAYRDIYKEHRVELLCSPVTAMVNAAPELLVQALDKLMENAASFCPPGGLIRLSLQGSEDAWALAVSNDGPPLPVTMQEQLFDPMVSIRETPGAGMHLGLGLHIVKLVAQYHHARVVAGNLDTGSGARFTLLLPRYEPGSTRAR